MTDNLSFYDWCAAAWLRLHRRFAFDDFGAIEGHVNIWRQAWREGKEPEHFADDYGEGCDMDPLDGWNGPYLTGEPPQKVPFPTSAFDESET
jgi:hypothetical protein